MTDRQQLLKLQKGGRKISEHLFDDTCLNRVIQRIPVLIEVLSK